MIPREIGITTGPFLYNSWRIFVCLCGTPAFLVAISLFGFPESPQFLALHGKPEFALKVISKIYASNKGLHYTSFPVIINALMFLRYYFQKILIKFSTFIGSRTGVKIDACRYIDT